MIRAIAGRLMREPVYEVIPIKRQPRWTLLMLIPPVAAVVLRAPLWLFAIAGAIGGLILTMVTETRSLAFGASRIGILRGNRWKPIQLNTVEREVSIDDIQPLSESALSRKVRVADKEYSTSKEMADRLFEALGRNAT